MKPRVLQLLTSLRPGGMERQTLQLARALKRGGVYDVRVAALGAPGPLLAELRDDLGVAEVPTIALRRMYDHTALSGVSALAAFMRAERVSVLHAHDFYTNVIGIAAAVLARVPVRVASRREEDVFTRSQRRVEHAFCARATVIAANCEHLRTQLLREGVPDRKVAVLRNAVDAERLEHEAGDQDARQALGIPTDAPLVTMLANLHNTRKDLPTFVEAASLAARRHPNAFFVVAGAGDASAVHALARTLSPVPRLLTPGLLLRPAALLAASTVAVLTSLSEGMPNAVLEAMALGRPVVATDVGGTREAVAHGSSGYLCQRGDAVQVAARICELLDDPHRADGFGRRGAEISRTHFALEQQSSAVHALYDGLLRERGGNT